MTLDISADDARARYAYGRHCEPSRNTFDILQQSCLHCQRQSEDHVDGKCLFDATPYVAIGDTDAQKLLQAWLAAVRT